jgi:uncharacterized protein YfbU (UPF0304 family)
MCRSTKYKNKHTYTNKLTGEKLYCSTDDSRLDENWHGATREGLGELNNNYKEMTEARKQRLFDLIPNCLEDGYFKVTLLVAAMKREFKEFKKISGAWIVNNFGTYHGLIQEYNRTRNDNIKYEIYHRSSKQRELCKETNSNKMWITNGVVNRIMDNTQTVPYGFVKGRSNVKNKKN